MPKNTLRVAIAQINPVVGDLEGNSAKINEYFYRALDKGTDIVCFPELSLTGYPPEDLLLKNKFVSDNLEALRKLVRGLSGAVAVIGFVDRQGKDIFNAAAISYNADICGVYRKTLLPNYGVFDEKRYFMAGQGTPIFNYGGYHFGVNICEDIWSNEGPMRSEVLKGAKLILNINASPYHAGKIRQRQEVIAKQAKVNKVFIVYANLVGGQDELVFDGQSMVADNRGKIISMADPFKEDLLVADLDISGSTKRAAKKVTLIASSLPGTEKKKLPLRKPEKLLEETREVYQALLLGLGDYVRKNGFNKVVVGLSGGIDSSLVAVLAADALGNDNVCGVFMPSRYSSQESEVDARQLAQNLGINFITISIEHIYKMYLMMLEPHFSGLKRDVTEENLQARIRGNILMAFSNKFGWLVLATGNKSEMSTGYATLYGDMAGGFALIKDVPKTLVYKLSRYRNSLKPVIPERVLTKEPTAELRPEQKDSDTLPPYETLDPILKEYIEQDSDLNRILSLGFDKDTVCKVSCMVDKSEYKRRQSPPGVKITPKAFGRDRRMPITNRYKVC